MPRWLTPPMRMWPPVGSLEPCDQSQGCRLAATRRPHNGDELTGPNLEVNASHRVMLAIRFLKGLKHNEWCGDTHYSLT